ncbi:MAG: bifunctional pyr operon transcriptional regulator/uracil phosphoribosyltransferase PyrR [Cyclobacteriaceae bacterium]|jgi:pyrimidine operon attenuation protein / uracil phosphoribosyltransferase|nr:bifunctional pyr operon transcriptional regulator/uracil phosphoribosyltransferase PyrR [Cyclobacteriaceae bacterium]
MQKRLLLNSHHLKITISRLCHQLIENHDDFKNSVILGLQPKGIFLAERIKSQLQEITGVSINLGYLDTTFYRDDFRRRDEVITPNETRVPFIIEKKKVILVDDVLYTGRSVRAAMDAMIAFGRPDKVELLILIDRIHSRDLPVEANYVGKKVNTIKSQKVLVELKEQNKIEDNIWLIDKKVIK